MGIKYKTFICDLCDDTKQVERLPAKWIAYFHRTGLTFGPDDIEYQGKDVCICNKCLKLIDDAKALQESQINARL